MQADAMNLAPLVDDAIYTEAQAAQYLRMGRSGLRSRRWRGDSVPAWFTIGNRVVYRGKDIRYWIDHEAERAAKARK